MNAKQHNRLLNTNRGLIFGLTTAGMLTDGLHIADLLCSLAVFVWLWLPFCTRLEVRMLDWLDGMHRGVTDHSWAFRTRAPSRRQRRPQPRQHVIREHQLL